MISYLIILIQRVSLDNRVSDFLSKRDKSQLVIDSVVVNYTIATVYHHDGDYNHILIPYS